MLQLSCSTFVVDTGVAHERMIPPTHPAFSISSFVIGRSEAGVMRSPHALRRDTCVNETS